MESELPTDAAPIDFALAELPGLQLHEALHDYRAQGAIAPTRFFGTDAFVIAGYAEIEKAFQDEHAFPGHRMYQASFEPVVGPSFISEPDPKNHLRLRRLATPAFRSRAVASYERDGLSALSNELIDRLVEQENFDLVADFTARFPYLVISRLLGIPREYEDQFHEWAIGLLTFREDPERAQQARDEISRVLGPLVTARRAKPQNDVISELVQAEFEGRRLTDEEVLSHVRLLFPTGGETTHGSLGNVLYALLTHPGEWQKLCANPDRVERVVEEGLRWETPIAVLPRLSRSEVVEWNGTSIPADTWVLFAVAGANRDPAIYPDPDRFDPDRTQAPTMVFGRGPKSCPGMHLARRNMAVALTALAARVPNLELVNPDAALPRRTVLRCPDALTVRQC